MSRNVVLVTADSLRADHCGFMGHDGGTTPTLDAMAADGLVFENAIAPGPATPESMSAVATGEFLRPYNDHAAQAAIVNRRENVSRHLATHRTFAEVLSEAGYETIGFSPNPFTASLFNFDAGFDRYEDFLGGDSRLLSTIHETIFQRFVEGDTGLSPVRLLVNWFEGEEVFKSWEQYYDDVLAAVRDAEEPFFLWVFLLDTHLPYLVGRSERDGASWLDMWRYNLRLYRDVDGERFDPDEREALLSLYDATVRRVDDFVDRLRRDLADEDPVVVLHGDHGEAFGEHGTYGHEPVVYEENLHVPYLIANADRRGRIADPVSLRTIPATLASLAGTENPFSTQPSWDTRESPDPVASNLFGGRGALRDERWKYVWTDADGVDGELFDLATDPGEREDVAGEYTDVAGERTDVAGCYADVARSRVAHERERFRIDTAVSEVHGELEL